MHHVVLYLLINLISYANRAARFISSYGQGLTGPEAAWANRKYHDHRTLPPEMSKKSTKRSTELKPIIYNIFAVLTIFTMLYNFFFPRDPIFCRSWRLCNMIT
jgi:hypothetical protein